MQSRVQVGSGQDASCDSRVGHLDLLFLVLPLLWVMSTVVR